ncbi:response regulator [Lysinibacillus yapensis]|uniref:Response regulator n=1 Tax=Ureibacillus yapensis TaxID=2304605 RepID=A0A396SET2_9BACL|nr:response regulator [Lysinibacillus yapensis]RHW40026.1 response regulator [Lysinibacillus yapensis]
MKNILIVDDQKGIRLLLNEVFTKEGYNVYQAANGLEALKIIDCHKVDCMMLDMKIPGMNGLEILKSVGERNVKIPVFMMTAFEEEELIEEARRLGMTKYFRKPFNIFEIRDEVNVLLKEQE